MKKIATLFFLVIFTSMLNKIDIVIPVSTSVEMQNDYFFCDVNIEDKNITTTHFLDYFYGIEVVSISPFVSPLYKKQINQKLTTYYFTAASHEENINAFEKQYQNRLYSLGLSKEANRIYMQGVPIASTKIVCTENTLKRIKKISKNIIISEN